MSFLWRWVWGSKKSKKSVATNDVKKEEQTPKEDEMVKEDVDSLFSHVDDSFDKYLVPLDSFKVVIVGDAGVGKTSYLNLLVNNGNTTGFKPTYSPTYGVNVVSCEATITSNVNVSLGTCQIFNKQRYDIGRFLGLCRTRKIQWFG